MVKVLAYDASDRTQQATCTMKDDLVDDILPRPHSSDAVDADAGACEESSSAKKKACSPAE